MKMEDKANLPRVRIAVLGHVNVGKSGEFYKTILVKDVKSSIVQF